MPKQRKVRCYVCRWTTIKSKAWEARLAKHANTHKAGGSAVMGEPRSSAGRAAKLRSHINGRGSTEVAGSSPAGAAASTRRATAAQESQDGVKLPAGDLAQQVRAAIRAAVEAEVSRMLAEVR